MINWTQITRIWYSRSSIEMSNHQNCIHHIQYTFQWDFPCKTKVAKGDPYINSDCDEIFWATICHQKATLQVIPEYLSEFRVFLRHPNIRR